MKVNAVQKRAADALTVFESYHGTTATLTLEIAVVAAWTGTLARVIANTNDLERPVLAFSRLK